LLNEYLIIMENIKRIPVGENILLKQISLIKKIFVVNGNKN